MPVKYPIRLLLSLTSLFPIDQPEPYQSFQNSHQGAVRDKYGISHFKDVKNTKTSLTMKFFDNTKGDSLSLFTYHKETL